MDVKTTRLAQKLSVILEQEATILTGVRDLVTHENSSLVRMDAAEVLTHTKKKELLILQQSYLEQERLRLLRRLAEVERPNAAATSLPELIEQAEGPLREKLSALHSQLCTLVFEIQARSAENNRLLSFMLQTLEGSILFLMLTPKTTPLMQECARGVSASGAALALATG